MEYRRLMDALQSKGVSNRAAAATISMPEATFRVKINGQTEGGFTMDEAIAIKTNLFPEMDIIYLFTRNEADRATV